MRQGMRALRERATGSRLAIGTGLIAALLGGCASAPPPAPLDPARTLEDFDARRLGAQLPGLPAAADGWGRAQWLAAALQLNPDLAAQRASVAAVAAAERTAAEIPNPGMELFAEYVTTAAQSTSWLYGLSLDFVLPRPGERARARRHAALETALAGSDLAESLWQVRAGLRSALLEAVAARDEGAVLASLVSARRALLASDRARLEAGEIDRTLVLADELELSRAGQRLAESRARADEARVRLAAAVGVPVAALGTVPLRWDDWAAIDALPADAPAAYRTAALIGRPQIVRALREYDLAEVGLQGEVARRWPQLHVTPAYAWGGSGVRQGSLADVAHESAIGVSFELPIFNQHQGAIGEAVARRAAAGEHLKSVQAQVLAQIDRAALAWPAAREAWAGAHAAAGLAGRQRQAQQRALAVGAGDRAALLAAEITAAEAQLTQLQSAEAAQEAFGALEDAYRRPLEGEESAWPPAADPRT